MSRTSKAWEALQDRLSQAAETVTRSSRVDIVSGGVDEIDPPEDIDEYAELVKNTGIVRANLRKFVNDVWEPGYRVEGPDETVQYFEGEKEDIDAPAPEDTPEGGFLSQAAVYGGEKHQEFYDFGKEATYQRWVRGTVLVEYLKADRTDPESPISGFHFIRPETVYPRVENNTNILLPPEKQDLPSDISVSDVDLTPRDEVAAYVQFDDESVLGLRNNGFDKQDIPLSQNDVLKQTLEPDIGGDIGTAEGVFGTSVVEAINEDIEEYKRIKRDRAEAIGRKAYGIWTAQFTKETYEFGNTTEVVEWGDDAIKDTEKDLQDLGPGDVLSSDAGIDLERFDGEVPELEPTLMHYVDDIMSALPAPKYLTGFSNDINRDVASDQESGYHDLVSEERNVQEESWTTAIREVATRKGLDTEGLEFKIQPKQEDNPVKSLSTEEIDRMNTYVSTLNQAAGPQAGPTALVDGQEILEVMDFPVEDMDAPEDVAAEMADSEAAKEAWNDIIGLESLATQYSEGDVVGTPQGVGIVSGVFTEGFDDVEASENSPAYAVALKDERVGSEFYKASQLSEGELPEVDVADPAKDIEAMVDIANASGEWEALDWSNPESWRESETPARVIALKAWADMNGQFDCGGGCCMGDLKDAELCGSFKDYILGTTEWRGWGDPGNESLAGDSGTEPFADVPVVPTGIDTLTNAWLVRWAEWVAAGKPEIPKEEALGWNPALHPRDPETGQFVERPFNVPDDIPDFEEMGAKGTLEYIADNGGDVDGILDPESGVTIDGVPNDATSLDEIPEDTDEADPTTEVTEITWHEDTDERAGEIETAIRQLVTFGTPEGERVRETPLPEDEERRREWLEKVPANISKALAKSKDPEVAQKVLENFKQLGDGGNNGSGQPNWSSGSIIKLSNISEYVGAHEMGHTIHKEYDAIGNVGTASDKINYRGEIPDYDWDNPEEVIQKYTVNTPEIDEDATELENRSLGVSEWRGRVDDAVGENLTARNFTTPGDDWMRNELQEGKMVQFEEYPLQKFDQSGPTEWTVTNRDGIEVTLEGPNGESFEAEVDTSRFKPDSLSTADIQETNGFLPDVIGKRETTPGTWGLSNPDADAIIGELETPNTVQGRMDEIHKEANAAWYKQHRIANVFDNDTAEESHIINSYSSTTSQEVLAQMHEVMTGDKTELEEDRAAYSLANHHPRLLERYRQQFEIPDGMREKINKKLSERGAEARL